MGKRVVPPLLKLGGDETVLGFSRLILPFETVGFVACLLKCKVKRASLFVGLILAMIESIECCLDSEWPQRLEDFDGNGLIDSGPREGDARAGHSDGRDLRYTSSAVADHAPCVTLSAIWRKSWALCGV